MNFVQFKNYTILAPTLALFFGFIPGTIISEPQFQAPDISLPPLTILYSGITKFDTGNGLLIRINSANPDELMSVCDDDRILIETTKNSSTIQWKPEKNCKIPLISYKGKNYLLPLSQTNISLDILSDISSETLRNTLEITTLLNTDTKLSTLKTRKIIRNIGSILEVRNNRFILPIE